MLRKVRIEFEAREDAKELKELRRGWVLGSEAFRDRMSELVAGVVKGKRRDSYTGDELRRHDESAAQDILARGLEALGMKLASVRMLRHSDLRKQCLAWLIRTQTIVGDDWIRQHLDMGHRSNVSRAVSAFRSGNQPQIKRLKRAMHVCTD